MANAQKNLEILVSAIPNDQKPKSNTMTLAVISTILMFLPHYVGNAKMIKQ